TPPGRSGVDTSQLVPQKRPQPSSASCSSERVLPSVRLPAATPSPGPSVGPWLSGTVGSWTPASARPIRNDDWEEPASAQPSSSLTVPIGGLARAELLKTVWAQAVRSSSLKPTLAPQIAAKR